MDEQREKELLETYVRARTRKEANALVLKESETDLDLAETAVIEYLDAVGKKDTGTYPGLGKVALTVPLVYASCTEENREACFQYLRSIDRGDLIKEAVNSRSLSSLTKELLEANMPVPDCISFYKKSTFKFTRS